MGGAEIHAHPFFATVDWERVSAKDYTPEFLPAIEVWLCCTVSVG